MGTEFAITLYASNRLAARTAARDAFEQVARLESILSDYDADSELRRLCEQPPGIPVPVSSELLDVLRRAREVSQRSDGAFDVTIGPMARLWRWARKKHTLPTAAEIAAAREAVGWRKLKLDSRTRTVTLLAARMRLDTGGIGKGYAADAALARLYQHGIRSALVAASGDIAVGDPPPGQAGWRVAVAAPGGASNAPLTTLVLRNAGVSTSGDTEQFVEIDGVRYSHVVNPATGLGLTEHLQVTVVAPDATTSDSLATAVSVLGGKRGLALIESWTRVAALIVVQTNDHKEILTSRRFQRLPQNQKP